MTVVYSRDEIRGMIKERTADLAMAVRERAPAARIEALAGIVMRWATALKYCEESDHAVSSRG